ncbi:hypothetical protein INP51_14995 [Blautia liquoris]|uniref:Chromosome segregation protein n=1 Tax=Blautia liquoris TaxID=2779518 RepID=A0A7M2RGR2_9FIRM|nr:hypothetical protein [Blautia liquoris]QOV19231.1 hypothetical protein INP51_14995 [Blautia liquoris]
MIIESLSIVDFKDKTATSYDFSDGTNLIVSTGNKKGKSSLLKSIYYTLGFDIRQFPSGWNISNKVFQLKVKFDDGISHTVTRQSDIYKVDADDTPLNSKEYSEWLQITLGIDMKLPNKQSKKLHSVYSTALLLPFYIDQDDSWDGVLYRRVSDTLGQYSDVPKGIFEYIFSISDIEVQKLQNQINQYSEYIKVCNSIIDNLGKVLDNYKEKTSEVPEAQEIDRDKLDTEIKNYLRLVNEYGEVALTFKIKLVKKREELDLQRQDFDELNQLLKMNEKRHKYIETECKYCHSKLTQEQSLTRLGLNNNKFEIIVLRDKISKKIEKLEQEVKDIQCQQYTVEEKIDELNSRIQKSKQLLTIDEYIKARAKTVAVSEIENTVEKEKATRLEHDTKKKELQKEKRKLEKEKEDLKNQIKTTFDDFKNRIRITLGLTDSNELGFLEFKKIDGSGMDKNIKYLGYYLMYFSLIEKYGIYKIPFCMDSFIKNEISTDTANTLFQAIEKYFLSLEHQIFFSIVTDNVQYLESIKSYNIIQVEEHLLSSDKYEAIASQIMEVQ